MNRRKKKVKNHESQILFDIFTTQLFHSVIVIGKKIIHSKVGDFFLCSSNFVYQDEETV